MLKVEISDCKSKSLTLVYTFALVMASENTMVRNFSILKNKNFSQLGLEKDARRCSELLTI